MAGGGGAEEDELIKIFIVSYSTYSFYQFDSPGHTALYCFYSLMDERGYVFAFYVATKSMVSYSAMMGKLLPLMLILL